MSVNLLLVVAFVIVAVFLFAVEAFAVATGRPTISERIQRLGRSAPLVVVVVSVAVGGALVHFFACPS